MSEKKNKKAAEKAVEEAVQEVEVTETETPEVKPAAVDDTQAQLAAQEEKYLRLCAEYDNYRKRTAREKESAWTDAKAETADEAYRKGVELTMQQLKKVLADMGVEEIPALGQAFDANLHAAVMHVEDPDLGENTVKEVFQAGFKLGDTVIRYAMVVVAN